MKCLFVVLVLMTAGVSLGGPAKAGHYVLHAQPALPRVVVLATGGTIASRFDPAIGALAPAATGADLVRSGAWPRQDRQGRCRAGREHRQLRHDARHLAASVAADKRAARDERRRRRRRDPRHRHARGDRLLSRFDRHEPQTGDRRWCLACIFLFRHRRPEKPAQRCARRGFPGGGRQRRTRRDERADQRRARGHENEHHRSRDIQDSRIRRTWRRRPQRRAVLPCAPAPANDSVDRRAAARHAWRS